MSYYSSTYNGIIIQIKNKFAQNEDESDSIDQTLLPKRSFNMSERNITYLTNAV